MAKHHLESKRYAIWHTNWRCPIGEIDIIASNSRELVFVEVKTRNRSETCEFDPINAVDARKRKKIESLMRWYIRHMSRKIKRAGIRKYRFDIIGITYSKSALKDAPEVEHLKDV